MVLRQRAAWGASPGETYQPKIRGGQHESEAARGQGLARRLCIRLLTRARDEGARAAYLQVDAANHAARSLYARLGFADGYAYHYRTLSPRP